MNMFAPFRCMLRSLVLFFKYDKEVVSSLSGVVGILFETTWQITE